MIYIHIPFCAKKCNYCAFNSKVGAADEIQNYVEALTTEIISHDIKNISTIYFGGGTPSILKIAQIEKIFAAVKNNFNISDNAEITIEINPGTVDKNYLRGLHEIGFNRVSIGVQSFSDNLLKILGRIHNSKIALDTIQTARNFFDNVSIDLMYGLPDQNISDLKNSVEIATNCDIQHISIYGLEIEEGTNFYNRRNNLNLPTDEICEEMYDFITETLPTKNFIRYEVSNFAKKNFESRHNIGYWTGKKYFGFGAGAHSYNKKIRTANISAVGEYIKNPFAKNIEEIITKKIAMEEFCFLGLRMTAGISISDFQKNFGENIFSVYDKVIEKNISRGLLENIGDKIFLTARGMKFGNMVFADFLL